MNCAQYKNYRVQPYFVHFELEALFILNVHSHISKQEVIGFLGGQYIKSQTEGKTCKCPLTLFLDIIVQQVYPCDSVVPDARNRSHNVDLCPESANLAREKILKQGQRIVGWYHSHPVFKVEPSVVDINNHELYQKMFEADGFPFIAAIIGPYYDQQREESLLKVFHNKKKVPYSLQIRQLPAKVLHERVL